VSNQYDAITWAIRVRGVSAGAYRLLIELAKRVGKRGFDVWPSYSTMAEDAELSVSSARRCVDELIAARLLEKISNTRPNGATSSNVLRLQVRSIHSFEGRKTQHIRPDDGQEEDEHETEEGVLNLDRGGAQNEQGALFTAEHGMELESYELESTEQYMSDIEIADAFVERWNTLADECEKLSRITKLGDKRKASLLARISDYEPKKDRARVAALIDRVLETIRGSRFLRGESGKPFKATPDWALTPKYFPKLEETGYAQDALAGGSEPAAFGGRSHIATGQAVVDVLNARGGTARRSARELAGLPARSPASAG
jgi:hypothetical protein